MQAAKRPAVLSSVEASPGLCHVCKLSYASPRSRSICNSRNFVAHFAIIKYERAISAEECRPAVLKISKGLKLMKPQSIPVHFQE